MDWRIIDSKINEQRRSTTVGKLNS